MTSVHVHDISSIESIDHLEQPVRELVIHLFSALPLLLDPLGYINAERNGTTLTDHDVGAIHVGQRGSPIAVPTSCHSLQVHLEDRLLHVVVLDFGLRGSARRQFARQRDS